MIEAVSQHIHIVQLSSCLSGECSKVFYVKLYNTLAYTTITLLCQKTPGCKNSM